MLGFLSNLRDVKSALSAGMLLLFAVWLLVGDEVARVEPGDTIAGRVAILVRYLGPAVTVAVITFVAYVLGLVLPFHSMGLSVLNRVNRTRAVKEGSRTQDARLFEFILTKVKRAAKKSSLEDLMWDLYREIPAFQDFSVRSPWWIRFAPPRFRSRLKGAWTRKAANQAIKNLASKGDEEPIPMDHFAVRQNERKMEKDLASLLLQRIYSESALLAVDLGHTDDKAYDRFDKARGESEFRAGLCLPLLILAMVIALQFPPSDFVWIDVLVISVIWGAVGVIMFLWRIGRAPKIFWGVVGVSGIPWVAGKDFGIPWGAVGVLGVGCLATLVLGLWAQHKSREAQEEVSSAIILGRINVPELQVLEAAIKLQEPTDREMTSDPNTVGTPSIRWRSRFFNALWPGK